MIAIASRLFERKRHALYASEPRTRVEAGDWTVSYLCRVLILIGSLPESYLVFADVGTSGKI